MADKKETKNIEKEVKEETNKEEKSFAKKAKGIFEDVEDVSNKYTKKEKEDGKIMSILAYIGILCLIPYFAEKENKYVTFHAKQGLNLFLIEIIGSLALSTLTVVVWPLFWLFGIINSLFGLATIGLSILGIVNVCNNQAKELPVINKIKIIK